MLATYWIRAAFAAAITAGLVLSRFPIIPSTLVTFDAANFAFALEDFNPALHKPQPPGYPLYVALIRLIHIFIEDLPTLFAVAGMVATLGAVIALARLAEDLLGWRAAVAAGVLLTFHPALWTEGLLNPVRAFLAFGSASIALLAWRAWAPCSHRGWIIGAWAALGLFAGFRPTVILLLGPLCFAAGIRRRTSFLDWLYCGLALSMTVAAWVGICAWAVGGVSSYVALLRDYSDQQFADTSLLFGAALLPALKMAGRAVIWSFAPAVCWLWLIFGVSASIVVAESRRFGLFLLIWTVPALLFTTLVHSAEPGHVLTIVTPVCLAGGLVTAAALHRFSGLKWTVTCIAAIAILNILLFCYPPTKVMKVISAQAVRLQESRVEPTLALIDQLSTREHLTVIASPLSTVPWRVLSYYHPNVPLVVLHKSSYWVMRHGRLEDEGTDRVSIACAGSQLWLLPDDSFAAASGLEKSQRVGPAFLTHVNASETFRVNGVEFVPALPCPPLLAQE